MRYLHGGYVARGEGVLKRRVRGRLKGTCRRTLCACLFSNRKYDPPTISAICDPKVHFINQACVKTRVAVVPEGND